MRKSQLAVNSVSTRGDLEEKLSAYREAGFEHVEFVLSDVKKYMAQGHTIADVRRMLERHGLRCIGGFEGIVQCFSPEPERLENHKAIALNARMLAELGASILVVGTDGPKDVRSVSDPLGEMARVFDKVAGEIASTGVILCIEFNWSPIVKSLRTAVEIARRSERENVGVVFDPAHYHCTPTKPDQINAESVPYIKHVHVDDMRDKPGELSDCNADRVLPGDGCLDLNAIFGALEAYGYKGYFSIEMFDEELWRLSASEAARRMYGSLLPYCR